MKKDDKESISLIKILGISLVLIFMTSIGVMASNASLTSVKIILSNDYEMTVLTSKKTVGEILEENHIVLLEDETVTPDKQEELPDNKTIKIVKKTEEEQGIAKEEAVVTTEEILATYDTIVEKIVTEQVEIPFETITKEATGEGTKQNQVIQKGQNGLKEVKYKVKYQDDIEVERTQISETIIKEPVDKIIQISTKVSSRSGTRSGANGASLASLAAGKTPKVVTLNASAYTASTCGKSPSDSSYGRTASGAMASSWYTVAAGSGYPIGTIIYIPYFASKANGGWFVVQDRGGAINGNRIDIYFDSHSEALKFGRRTVYLKVL